MRHSTNYGAYVRIIRICKFLSAKKWVVWGALITNGLLAILVSMLFVPMDASSRDFFFYRLFMRDLWLTVAVFIICILLTLLVWAIGNQEIKPSEQELLQQYLRDLVQEVKPSSLKGLSTTTTLILYAVPLTEVFIPLQLRANRPLIELPLSEEERARVREALDRGDELSEGMQDILLSREREWLRRVEDGDRLEMIQVWEKLTPEHPAAVIQGYPGMGKSTLMERLALHMALRILRKSDPTMPTQFDPVCIPIIVRLNDYATKQAETEKQGKSLKIIEYIDNTLAIDSFGSAFLRHQLQSGNCVVLFDGLDEVNEANKREEVQSAIKLFVRETRTTSEQSDHFNRYFITSRVAGYQQNAFEDYLHYIIAELSKEQIEMFLPRWCRATVHRTMIGEDYKDEEIGREAEILEQKLRDALYRYEGVRQLAQNPLLLTLLAVMQHNKIELPKRRVLLYRTVSHTLLESRNAIRGLPTIPEEDVVQRLGPIAIRMQEADINLIHKHDVMETLRKTIPLTKGGTQEEIEKEAEDFLLRLRHRSGLFVQRSGDFLGFFHRTFQEYFAARSFLAQIEQSPESAIPELVERAKRPNAHWREPFLLAVTYQSTVNRTMASRIIEAFLSPQQSPTTLDDLVLVTECLIESESSSFHPDLEKRIATELLVKYEEAQGMKCWKDCERIENALCAWLLSIHKEAYRPPLLDVLTTTITNTAHVSQQRAVLTLLSIIAQRLVGSAPVIFQMLVPALQTLTGLTVSGDLKPAAATAGSNFDVIDLALATISLFGISGPGGAALTYIRQHLEKNPAQLRILARYSLESGTLLTPTTVPLSDSNYQHYLRAVEDWFTVKSKRVSEQAISDCIEIHQQLLQYAEDTCYPACYHLLNMLQLSERENALSWQQGHPLWRSYLNEQITRGTYIDHRLCALLWSVLLQDQVDQEALASILLTHYTNDTTPLYQYSQRIISIAANHLRDLRDLRDLVDLGYFRDLREIRGIEYFRDMRYLRGLLDSRYMKEGSDLRYLRHLRGLDYVRDSRYLRSVKAMDVLLLTDRVAVRARQLLDTTDMAVWKDALILLLGRVLQVQESDTANGSVEQEIQEIVKMTLTPSLREGNPECQEIILEIVRSLPARTNDEIRFVLQTAGSTNDTQIQNFCAFALRRARPDTEEGWQALESGLKSDLEVIRLAAKEALKRKKYT
jgi:hypothetical protein